MRRWILVAAIIGVAALAYTFFPTAKEDGPGKVEYATEALGKRRIAKVVSASGTLSPVTQVQVGSQVSGTIKALHADYNSEVNKGDVIAEIDPRLFQTAVSQARARLASANAQREQAKARLEVAQLQFNRVKDLPAGQAVSQTEKDTLAADVKAAQAQVAMGEAQVTEALASLDQAKTNLAYTTINAPIDGIVVSRNVEVGQTVAASLSAPVLFVIAGNLREMEVHTSVPEADIGQLDMGMEVEFEVDAFPGDSFSGRVKQIRFEATTISNVVTYDAVVAVDNEGLKLRPGMTANASFVVAELESALAIPNKALRFKPPSPGGPKGMKGSKGSPPMAHAKKSKGPPPGKAGPVKVDGQKVKRNGSARQVYILRDKKPVAVSVNIGVTDGSYTELTGGELQEGDEVVTSADSGKGKRRRGPPTLF
jgi:HlyD family secretion protein